MLSQEQVDKVKIVFSMSGWQDVIKPIIENRMRQKIKALMLFPAERAESDRDDTALRAGIQELEWLLVSFVNEITVFEHNRRVDELHEQEQEANGMEAPA